VAIEDGEGAALLGSMGIAATITASTFLRRVTTARAGKRSATGFLIRPKRARGARASAEHELLFAGTEFRTVGIVGPGRNWNALKSNFPTVPVDDIEIQARENDLVLATHGRSIWIFDDLTPIEDGCERGGIAANILPAPDGHDWHLRKPTLERQPESVHGEESAVRRDLELLPEGSCATGSAEERQRGKGQERRGREKPKTEAKATQRKRRKAK